MASLPDAVWSVLGPIPVVFVNELKDDKGEDLFGEWDSWNRVIRIRDGISPVAQMHAIVHEYAHAVLHDFGVKLFEADEERVCDAMASAITAEWCEDTDDDVELPLQPTIVS